MENYSADLSRVTSGDSCSHVRGAEYLFLLTEGNTPLRDLGRRSLLLGATAPTEALTSLAYLFPSLFLGGPAEAAL